MSTKAEKLKAHVQRENSARKRALAPPKSVKTHSAKSAPLAKAMRRTVKRKAVASVHARVG